MFARSVLSESLPRFYLLTARLDSRRLPSFATL